MAREGKKVTLIGNIDNEQEVRYKANGSAVANVSIATAEAWKERESGHMQERTEWHRVVFFSRLAEIVGEYLKKGSQVYIEGRLQTRKWQDRDGNDKYTTEIVANEMQMLGGRGGAGNGPRGGSGGVDNDGGGTSRPINAPSAKPEQPMENIDDAIPI